MIYMNLTDSQRMFCQLVVEGLSHTEAYLQAYDRCTSRNSARACAPRLLAKVSVSQEIERLRTEMENWRGLTRQEKRKILRKIANDETQPANERIKAIATDNKMMGHDAPDRVQVEVGSNQLADILNEIRSGESRPLKRAEPILELEMNSDTTGH